MKKTTIVIVLLLLISNIYCVTKRKYKKIVGDVYTLHDINRWINKNIMYLEDKHDYWQLPSETLEKKTGDCEDMVILFMDMSKKLLNKEVLFLFIASPNDIQKGHVLALHGYNIFDPTTAKTHLIYVLTIQYMVWAVYTEKNLYQIIEFRRREPLKQKEDNLWEKLKNRFIK